MTVITMGIGQTCLMCGVGENAQGVLMPFVAFVPKRLSDRLEREKSDGEGRIRGKVTGQETLKIISQDATVVFFDNPEAADLFYRASAVIFTAAFNSDWRDRVEPDDVVLQ